MSTSVDVEGEGGNVCDGMDSSFTRMDGNSRLLFGEAGLWSVGTDMQSGFPKDL